MKNTRFNGTEYYLNNHLVEPRFKYNRSVSLYIPDKSKIKKNAVKKKNRLEKIYGVEMKELCKIGRERVEKRQKRKKEVIGFQSLRNALRRVRKNERNVMKGLKKRVREIGGEVVSMDRGGGGGYGIVMK